MGKVIDLEFWFCPNCGHRVTKQKYSYLLKNKPCPLCSQPAAGSFKLFTCNPNKYTQISS